MRTALTSRFRILFALLCVASPISLQAEELAEAVQDRWSENGSGGTPEFERHIIPLMGRVGCNNRACHGSFQGQNGFRLSLFGHDAQMDFDELTKDEGDGPRVNLKKPAESLALQKATSDDIHEGGKRFEKESWQYRLFHQWIADGAPLDRKKDSVLERLVVEPLETSMTIGKLSEPLTLRTVAYFSDGTSEDVTALTLFSTNDESVASVDETGLVKAVGSGDTAIVSTYGGAVVTTQVIVPVTGKERPPVEFLPYNPVDEFVLIKLNKLGVAPSELCSDETFIRRVFLDLIGTLPTADEVRTFLADDSPAKRSRLVDQLLSRAEYGMYWATKFSDWTGNDNRFTPQPRAKTAWLWQDWLRDKVDRNVPYDEIVGGILTATTREGRPIEEVAEEYFAVHANLKKGFDDGTYGRRKTNDIFWQKATNGRAETVALQTAYAFLGIRLECAQCHKHPFDRWTQDDFRSYTAIFNATKRGNPKDLPKKLAKKVARNEYRYNEVSLQSPEDLKKRLKNQPMRVLAGEEIDYESGVDPRAALWEWMRSPDNAYFAPAIANRFWGHYFGVGIVDPIDDFNAANPASNPQLLNWLATDFIEHGFDLKHMHRRILNSRAYQSSWRPNESNRLDEKNFSHALLKRMPAEVVLDAINQVTGGSDSYSSSNAPPDVRTIDLGITRLRGGGPEYVLGIFGRPLRTQTCDCERRTETGLAQAMYLLNDSDVNQKIADPKGRLAQMLQEFSDDRLLIDELYLSTLSRFPREDEVERSLAFVEESESRLHGFQDLLWSLINVREFIFIR